MIRYNKDDSQRKHWLEPLPSRRTLKSDHALSILFWCGILDGLCMKNQTPMTHHELSAESINDDNTKQATVYDIEEDAWGEVAELN